MSMAARIIVPAMIAFSIPTTAKAQAQVPADLQVAMRARDKAAAEKDAPTWDRYTAEEFLVVLPDGVRRTKADRLAHLKTQKPGVWVPPQDEVVKVYGNTAVQHFLSDGDWALVVWVKGPKGWQVVAGQDTPAKN